MSTPGSLAASAVGTADKRADTLPNVHDLIQERWSPRAFSDRDISAEDLKTVLEAARWAASSYNEQPWRFLVARKSDPPAFNKILDLLAPSNQVWAENAPVLMIMVAKRTFSHNGSPNLYGVHDTGQALAHLFLQATALGLHAHGIAGFDRERARQELKIPDDYDFGAAVAIGYAGSPDHLPENYQKMEVAKRTRKPLEQIVFTTNWDEPLPL